MDRSGRRKTPVACFLGPRTSTVCFVPGLAGPVPSAPWSRTDKTSPFFLTTVLSAVRVLFDTNIIIDAAVPARPHHDVALQLLSKVDRGRISGVVAPTSLATCWYVSTTHHEVDPRPLFETIESIFDFALMNRAALRAALDADPEVDFEDLYLAAAGRETGARLVVTRNEQDFAGGPLSPYRPEPLLSMIER